jgi:oxygen-independent coproporphyrinogen III oxidase
MTGEIIDRTVDSIEQDILRSPLKGIPADTIFFGGGTPTFITAVQLDRLLKAVFSVHPPVDDCEITSEANPGTVDASKFGQMKGSGFNRISLGAQSFLDSDLIRLDRVHKAGEIDRAVQAARQAGFENINLDLMFALPDQSTVAWKQNLHRALSLRPEHLSLYCLTIEQNTAFYKKHLRNELNLPDDETQRAMYDECVSTCAEHGYELYEISNFSQPGRLCRHNMHYWRSNDYISFGPGAVGCIPTDKGRMRYTNLKHPVGYSEAVENGEQLYFESEFLTPEIEEMERIMLGLRLKEGLRLETNQSTAKLIQKGWLEEIENRYRLTEEGRHFCSEAALELIP